jgi:nucleoside-diphosphate-sugar epimerase
MKTLLTGASGFLGSYVLAHLNEAGNEVLTVGRSAVNGVLCDLKSEIPQLEGSHEFDMVIHNAGMAHKVPKTEAESKAFFEVNVGGTKNLLEALTSLKKKPRCFVFVSTVAVYGVEVGEGIDETHALLGVSPYAKSKIEAEYLVQDWCDINAVNCVILRLPLVVGEQAPGNLGAMEKAIRKGYYFRLGSGKARRSMVNALDVARLMPKLVNHSGIFNLTDGVHRSFAEMDELLAKKHGKRVKKIPVWMGRLLAKVGDLIPGFPLNSYRLAKLEQSLTFDDTRARKVLGWGNDLVSDPII